MATDSTLDDIRRVEDGPVPRWGRRAGLAVLFLVVAAGAFGVFGVHSRTIHAHGSGYDLTVTYPQTARAGLDVPFRVAVHHDGGFAAPLTVAITADWFRMFETQGFFPDADSSTSDGRFVYFTFAKPRTPDFVFEYDAYIQPAAQLGKSATIEIITAGRTVATASVHTWLAP